MSELPNDGLCIALQSTAPDSFLNIDLDLSEWEFEGLNPSLQENDITFDNLKYLSSDDQRSHQRNVIKSIGLRVKFREKVFKWRKEKVGSDPTVIHSAREGLQWASRNLEMQLLPSHYHNGQLILRCIAEILELYAESTDAPLWSTRKEPIPERVTSPSSGRQLNENLLLAITPLLASFLILYFRR